MENLKLYIKFVTLGVNLKWDNYDKEFKYEYDSKGNVIKSVGKVDDERKLVVLYEWKNYKRNRL